MSPESRSDKQDEWERPFTLKEIAALSLETRHKILEWWDRSVADHAAARDLRQAQERIGDLEVALAILVAQAERANNYATRNEHFGLPQIVDAYIDQARALLTPQESLEK